MNNTRSKETEKFQLYQKIKTKLKIRTQTSILTKTQLHVTNVTANSSPHEFKSTKVYARGVKIIKIVHH
jgi:hypothetical protein